ncbi:DUF4397 domain-containing protein [Clostridium sp. Marseille-Q7071]
MYYHRNMNTRSDMDNMSNVNSMDNINNMSNMSNTNNMINMGNMSNMGSMITYVRLLHASPNAPVVDVYVNDKLLVKNFNYREFTDYVKLMPGTYNIKIYKSTNGKNLLYNNNLTIPGNTIFTVAAIGNFPENFELYPIEEKYTGVNNKNKAKIRFVHLIPNGPPVDVTIPVGNILFGNVMYKDITDYIEMTPGMYTFEITYPNSTTNILYIPNIRLRGDRFYTIYAIGLVGDEPAPQVLIPLDGLTYLKH